MLHSVYIHWSFSFDELDDDTFNSVHPVKILRYRPDSVVQSLRNRQINVAHYKPITLAFMQMA